MTFEIIAPNGRTHCSVLEFTAPEGTCYLPYWMMSNLTLTEGKLIRIRNVSLPKATFVKFQPQHVDFLDISNPRAVLEYKLRSFSCVTVGDHLAFNYNDRKYYLEVKEVKPQDAACIIEADVNVDFEAPVGYKEPERQAPAPPPKPALPPVQKAVAAEDDDAALVEAAKFKPFAGTAVRLDGKALKKSQLEAVQSTNGAAAEGSSSTGNGSGSSTASSSSSTSSSGGHNWGTATGSVQSGNTAAERRAAMLAAAEARGSGGGGVSSLSAASSSASSSSSPAKKLSAGPTKWSQTSKMGRFQPGAGNKLA
jgi:ubiquitin fusion degradation protein 1